MDWVELTVRTPEGIRKVEMAAVTTARYAACRVAEALGLPSEPEVGEWMLGEALPPFGMLRFADDVLASDMVGRTIWLGIVT